MVTLVMGFIFYITSSNCSSLSWLHLTNLWNLSVHDKGYFRNWSFPLMLISTFLLGRHNGMWNVYRSYVGDWAPVVEFATSFLVKSVSIGDEKNNNKNNNKKKTKNNKRNNPKKIPRKSYLPPFFFIPLVGIWIYCIDAL